VQTIPRAHSNAITNIMMWSEVRRKKECSIRVHLVLACLYELCDGTPTLPHWNTYYVCLLAESLLQQRSSPPNLVSTHLRTEQRPWQYLWSERCCLLRCVLLQSFLLTCRMDGTIKIWCPGSGGSEVINSTPEFKYPEEEAPAGGGRNYRQQVCVGAHSLLTAIAVPQGLAGSVQAGSKRS
jgi:hypothetical protein